MKIRDKNAELLNSNCGLTEIENRKNSYSHRFRSNTNVMDPKSEISFSAIYKKLIKDIEKRGNV